MNYTEPSSVDTVLQIKIVCTEGATIGAPEFTVFDDATQMEDRSTPIEEFLVGTTETNNISFIRAEENTNATSSYTPSNNWQTQTKDNAAASAVQIRGTTNTVTRSSGAMSLNDTFYLIVTCCIPFDATMGDFAGAWGLLYTWS